MLRTHFILMLAVSCMTALPGGTFAEPGADTRNTGFRDPDTYRLLTERPPDKVSWESRREDVLTTLRLRAGLIPEPEKAPLNARVFDERRGDGFLVSKVYYESLPGCYATGNLYRPSDGDGPFPAIITPHGHWQYGRLTNGEQGSIPGRCIDLARMGFVVFSIDMVGYNDCFQFPHDASKSTAQLVADTPVPYDHRAYHAPFPEENLYGFNLGGLQLWNAVRGVDFLTELPYVDTTRIGATGASGGASQTIFLMAYDDRIQAAAPVNIIGAERHPGCRCENMANLWIDTSTIELAATFAPRPLLLMSATEDPWTPTTPEREFPLMRSYYDFYGAGGNVQNVHIDAGHNYNADTRRAVYAWFRDRFATPAPPVENPSSVAPEMASLGDLRVFPDKLLPESAKTARQIIDDWKTASEKAFLASVPGTAAEWERFAAAHRELLRIALAAELPLPENIVWGNEVLESVSYCTWKSWHIGRRGENDSILLEMVAPAEAAERAVLIVSPEIAPGLVLHDGVSVEPGIRALVDRGTAVYRVHGFASGGHRIAAAEWNARSWPETYNRNETFNAVQDILTAAAAVRAVSPDVPLTLGGFGSCGIPSLIAAAIDGGFVKVAADFDGRDPGSDSDLAEILPVCGIRRIGDVRAAVLAVLDRPVLLYNSARDWDSAWYEEQAASLGYGRNLSIRAGDRSLPLYSVLR